MSDHRRRTPAASGGIYRLVDRDGLFRLGGRFVRKQTRMAESSLAPNPGSARARLRHPISVDPSLLTDDEIVAWGRAMGESAGEMVRSPLPNYFC